MYVLIISWLVGSVKHKRSIIFLSNLFRRSKKFCILHLFSISLFVIVKLKYLPLIKEGMVKRFPLSSYPKLVTSYMLKILRNSDWLGLPIKVQILNGIYLKLKNFKKFIPKSKLKLKFDCQSQTWTRKILSPSLHKLEAKLHNGLFYVQGDALRNDPKFPYLLHHFSR